MNTFEPVRFGKYLLLDRIAVGGMAELFRARITGAQGFEKLIAIKKILSHLTVEKDLVEAFIGEAKLAALLQHQNIIQIYDFGSMEGGYFIAMEHLFGKDLRVITNKSKDRGLPLTLESALYIASRICAGLDYAHNLKDLEGNPLYIIHRDISPPNIFITYDGEVKIVDFGIAKAASKDTTTVEGVIKGKVSYMSPEQAGGKSIDQRSDIFSTGILLYEMVTGRQMFEGEPLEILHKVCEAQFEPPEKVVEGLPTRLYEILHRALAKAPEKRYQSSGEMLSDLEDCMHQNACWPNERGLALYMKDLFEKEIATEEKGLRETAQIQISEESEGEKETLSLKGRPQKTDVLVPEKLGKTHKRQKLWYGGLGTILLVIIIGLFAVSRREEPVLRTGGGPEKGVPQWAGSTKIRAGMKALEEGLFAQAASLFKEVLAKEPAARGKVSGPYAKALVGQAGTIAERAPTQAKSLLLEAVKQDPGSVQANFQLGRVYTRLREYPKAIHAYQRAAKLDPESPLTYFNLAYVYAVTREYAKAEEMYRRVVRLAPSFLDEALFNLAMVQQKQGKRGQSIKNLERALRLNPNNKRAKRLLLRLRRGSEG